MDPHQRGQAGESAAARYLTSQGWIILGRNVRAGRGEIDVIAMRGTVLAFVEVKCRRSLEFGHPLEAITPAKQAEIAKVARKWLADHSLPPGMTIRFDAVAVRWPDHGPPDLVHVPDAWRLE